MAPSNGSGRRLQLPTQAARPASNENAENNGVAPSSIQKSRLEVVDKAIAELDALPINPKTGRMFRNSGQKIYQHYLALYGSWLTVDMIKSKRSKRKRKRMKQVPEKENQTTVMGDRSTASKVSLEDMKPAALGGRKKGSTIAAMDEMKRKFCEMKNDITVTWMDKSKRPKGMTLAKHIEAKQAEYGFDTGKVEHRVSKGMVKSRQQRKKAINSGMKGQKSPLESIEPLIVQLVKLKM